jgi:putative RecB family exonuclease
MVTYSHSRLSTFEQCPLKFKLKYLDCLESDQEGIEAFMGSRVHEALQKLYDDLKFMKRNSADDLVLFYNDSWEKNWHDDIKIVRKGLIPENYKETGERCIRDYYAAYQPFGEDTTIATETRILIKVDGKEMQGYIDRLSTRDGGVYIIHDYKTSASLPTNDDLLEDRQLRLYAKSIFCDYSDCHSVEIVWHYLSFNKEFRYSVTKEEAEKVWQEAALLVEEIESCRDFPGKPTRLCDWCEYRAACTHFKHPEMVREMPPEVFRKEEGVVLLNIYSAIDAECKAKEEELQAAKERLLAYARQHGMASVAGSDVRAVIYTNQRLSFPKREDPRQKAFIDLVKKLGLWEELESVDVYALARKINNKEIPGELIHLLDPFISRSVTETIRLYKR